METYALLGATGGTGSAILRCLLEEPPQIKELKIFVRSKSKLLKAFPNLEGHPPFRISITEGIPSNNAAMQRCLQGSNVIFMCIGSNESTPDTSICYDVTSSILTSLKALRQSQGTSYTPPTILQLRSTNLNSTAAPKGWINPAGLIKYCLHYSYVDLKRGCDLLETTATHDPALVDHVFVDPPGLHDAEGTTRTGHELVTSGVGGYNLSYADLGGGFCEVARRRSEFKGKGVVVSATGAVNTTPGVLVSYLLAGLKARWIG